MSNAYNIYEIYRDNPVRHVADSSPHKSLSQQVVINNLDTDSQRNVSVNLKKHFVIGLVIIIPFVLVRMIASPYFFPTFINRSVFN